jgi:hypothetical protein
MDNRARVEQAVFDVLRPQLRRYRGDAADLTSQVAATVAQANQHAGAVVQKRRGDLDRAQDELARCIQLCIDQGHSDMVCGGYRSHVAQVEGSLQRAIRARSIIIQEIAAFEQHAARYRMTVDQLLVRAEQIVGRADERTRDYQRAEQQSSDAGAADMANFAVPQPVSWRDLPGVSVPAHFPAGFALIPVALITDESAAADTTDSDAGQDASALPWCAEALLDVVLPAMSIKTDVLQYLRDRDEREKLAGERSYSATYSGFFTPDTAIRLEPRSDGKFDIVDGRQRLRTSVRTGAKSVPALIGGV